MADDITSAYARLRKDSSLMRHFPIDVFQTGSGTNSHMNANEVIARLAASPLGSTVSPNDSWNRKS